MFVGIGTGLVGGGVQTSIQSLLFGQSEPGFMFTPQDITTLYQDRAGTTPVTAAGQSVGLRLDKSQGLALGAELVTNGDFAAGATGWTDIVGAWAVTAGALVGTGIVANAYGPYSDNTSVVAGKFYRATFDVTVSSGSLLVRVGNDQSSAYTSGGTFTRIFQAISTGVTVFQLRAGGVGFTGSIDNISVRELAGNHEVAISDAKRGVYGWMPKTGRRNLLTYTEQFSDIAWALGGSTLLPNNAVAPDGTTTADKISEDSTTGVHRILNNAGITVSSGVTYTWSVYVKASERSVVRFVNNNLVGATFDLANGAASSNISAGITPAAVSVGNGWYRLSISGLTATTIERLVVQIVVGGTTSYTGVAGSGIFVWGAQLETGSSTTAYQRVVSQYDITEAGVPTCYYVQADGADDAYVTPTITPGTDKAQVFAGVRKLSSGPTGSLFLETSTDSSTNAGALYLLSFSDEKYYFRSGGSSRIQVASEVLSPPITNVITGLGDISGDTATLRVNGTQVAQSTADQGTGNYLAYPAYIYSRGGTTLPFNGLDFGHAVRFGPNLDAATIARVEILIARNTPEVDFMFGGVWTDQYNWDDETNWNDGA